MSEHFSLQRWLKPVVNPAVFDFWAGSINRLWAWERVMARVVERRPEARDAVTLLLHPNRHFQGFRPGQHVNVSAEVNGRRVTRSYSFTGVPGHKALLSLTVKRVDGGLMSEHLCRQIAVGDVLELGAVFGDMVWPEPAGGHWLLLAAGSGITPMMSLLRAQAAAGWPAEVVLLYWAGQRADLCFLAELQAMAAATSRFRLQQVLTAESELLPGEERGRIRAELLVSCVPDAAIRRVYACGPAGFVASARELLADKVTGFHAESFTPPVIPAGEGGTVRVTLAASGRVLELPRGQALLPALEAQGIQPEHGCRIGICNTCACGKRSGVTEDLNSGEQSDQPTQALRLCISRPRSDLVLDL